MDRDPKEYEKLIIKIAHDYLPSFYKEKEMKDLIQEGYEVFMEVCIQEKSKSLPCPFHTVLAIQIKSKWINNIQSRKYQKNNCGKEFISLSDLLPNEIPDDFSTNPYPTVDKYIDLSKEMKEVVRVLLNAPDELIQLSKWYSTPESLGKYFRKFEKWPVRKVKKMKAELSPLL